MPRTEYMDVGSGNSYALPIEDADPYDAAGAIAGVPVGATGVHEYAGLGDGVYLVYLRATGVPLVTDLVIGQIGVGNVPIATPAEIAESVWLSPDRTLSDGGTRPIVVITPEESELTDGDTITITQGDDYSGDRKRPIEIDTEADMIGQFIVLAIYREGTRGFAYRAQVHELDGKQVFDIELSKQQTSAFTVGDWNYIVRHEHAIDKESRLKSGIWRVIGFVTPQPIQGADRS